MKKLFKLAFMLAILVPQYSVAGRIILAADEWATSNSGFASAPSVSNYVQNIASLFSGSGSGTFHAYSNNFSLTQSSLANAMTSAGHTWSTGLGITFDLPNLLSYDGIFFAGGSGDLGVIADYISAGGNVYIAGGTSSNAAATASFWNPLLNQYGLEFSSTITIGKGNEPISSMHTIFNNVSSLYQDGGQEVFDINPSNPMSKVLEFNSSGRGVYAIYDTAVVPIPAALWLFGSGLIGLIAIAKRKKA